MKEKLAQSPGKGRPQGQRGDPSPLFSPPGHWDSVFLLPSHGSAQANAVSVLEQQTL